MTTISDQKISDTTPSTATAETVPFEPRGFYSLLESIERTRPNVAEDDAHTGERGGRI